MSAKKKFASIYWMLLFDLHFPHSLLLGQGEGGGYYSGPGYCYKLSNTMTTVLPLRFKFLIRVKSKICYVGSISF